MRLGLKMLLVAGLTLVIMVPLMMIRGVIAERQGYRLQAVQDVAANYGGRQLVAGPVLVVPYTETVAEDVEQPDGTLRRVTRRSSSHWTFFPETLAVDGELQPDSRRRGLHEVRVYQWNGSVAARFDVRVPVDGDTARREIGRPWLGYGIADVGGLRGSPKLTIGGRAVPVEQGLGHADAPGVHARLAAIAPGGHLRLDTRMELRLRGTERFAIAPLGNANDLHLRSRWPHPKFEGKSPQHDFDGGGFRAHWQVAAVATNAQRLYLQSMHSQGMHSQGMHPPPPGSAQHGADQAVARAAQVAWGNGLDAVSVSLIDPVNPYLKAERATKYGLLFVALTFIGFFMFELVRQLPVHPVQYLLVGMAIAIFFLLLLSLSEHITFGWAYLAAAAACIGLIGFYLSAVLRSALRGAGFAGMLGALYAALYGLLLSEDNALVLGAGLLFVILAAVMVATRKVDWYRVGTGFPGRTT